MRRSSGGPDELEDLHSTVPPVDVYRIYDYRHRELRCAGTGARRDAASLDHVFTIVSTGPARVHGPLLVHAAVRRKVAHEEDVMKKATVNEGPSASKLIDGRIAELGDWRGKTL